MGSGSSTRVSAHALVLNEQDPLCPRKGDLTIIEPEPHRVPRDALGNILFPGLTNVHEKWLEEVPLSLFLELEAGDIFVIDRWVHAPLLTVDPFRRPFTRRSIPPPCNPQLAPPNATGCMWSTESATLGWLLL